MPVKPTPTATGLGRRGSLALGLALPWLIPARSGLAQARLVPTPAQTTGPFYPADWTGDIDGDLVRVTGQDALAQGVVTHLRGQVRDVAGAPVAGAVVEIWQCDALGRYLHPRDRAGPRDAGFQGRGRVITGADGGYAFRTIRPVAYPGRTPHIHVAVLRPGEARAALVSQFYVAGEAANARDGIFRALDEAARAAVMLDLRPAEGIEGGALLAVRDVVIG